MLYSEYKALINAWRFKYKISYNKLSAFDPTELRVSCFRCGRIKSKMHRHHTGNDLFFARMLPDELAPRYLAFHRDDVERLCDDCHRKAHKIYKNITILVFRELNNKGTVIVTKTWCETWKDKYRKEFYSWCARFKPRKKT